VPFDMFHMDIWGPYSTPLIHMHTYFLTTVDDYSRYTLVSLLKGKFQVQSLVQNFIAYVERQHNVVIKIARTDNGPELALRAFFTRDNSSNELWKPLNRVQE